MNTAMDESIKFTSFVIRFVQTPGSGGSLACRGSIRHVQSDEELHFRSWGQAVAFMRSYIPLNDLVEEAPQSDDEGI